MGAGSIPRAYEAGNFAKDARKCMNDLDDGEKTVDQFAIFVPIVFELRLSVSK